MSQNVIEKAKELAAIIAVSPEFISMRVAEDAASQDAELVSLFAQYAEKQGELEAIVCQDSPDFAKMEALSAELNALKEQVQNAPLAKTMQLARQKFNSMMQEVNAELQKVLAPESSASCSGNCASCGSNCSHSH